MPNVQEMFFYINWNEALPGATAVVSTLGGFGSEEQMSKINSEANVVAVNAANEYGSILSNLLLVLETSLLCGDIANLGVEQKYDRESLSAYAKNDLDLAGSCTPIQISTPLPSNHAMQESIHNRKKWINDEENSSKVVKGFRKLIFFGRRS
ncbi:hypothetical protein MTR_6g466340 [Medicago truncatula]|uniref:Uncharacterized protein n=1 Tax=Medicago truncatula TaxID=3880 RepID=G7ZXE3_MEDTR|nr:hypothetical protein MTR_6g466340 [Medicago truncatula]